MTAVRCTFKRDDVIRLLAVMTCTALVASAAAAAKVIETQTVTFRGNHVQARVTLATYPKAHGRHALYLFLRTRPPGAAAFREIALAALDDSRRRFEVRSFVVEPRWKAALVKVVWQRRGLVKTHRQYLLARVDSLRLIPPP